MKKHIVPFVHGLSDADKRLWISSISDAMPAIDIRPLADLSASERANAEVAIVANPDPADLAALPNLKWVQSLWAGVERLLQSMPDPSVEIVRLIDPQLAITMSEAALAWTLYLHRDMPRYARQQVQANWQQHLLPIAAQCRVSVLGLGQLGQTAALRLVANGFDVRGWSRNQKTLEGVQTDCGPEGMSRVLSQTDILIMLLPSTPATRNLLDGSALDRLPKGAQVINFARSDIIDTKALTKRLSSGQIKHAVLDVFAQEPLPPSDPLWAHPSLTVLPHISAPTNHETAAAIVAEHLKRWFDHGAMPTPVSRRDGY